MKLFCRHRKPDLSPPMYSGPPVWILDAVGLAWLCFILWGLWRLAEIAGAVARAPRP